MRSIHAYRGRRDGGMEFRGVDKVRARQQVRCLLMFTMEPLPRGHLVCCHRPPRTLIHAYTLRYKHKLKDAHIVIQGHTIWAQMHTRIQKQVIKGMAGDVLS